MLSDVVYQFSVSWQKNFPNSFFISKRYTSNMNVFLGDTLICYWDSEVISLSYLFNAWVVNLPKHLKTRNFLLNFSSYFICNSLGKEGNFIHNFWWRMLRRMGKSGNSAMRRIDITFWYPLIQIPGSTYMFRVFGENLA